MPFFDNYSLSFSDLDNNFWNVSISNVKDIGMGYPFRNFTLEGSGDPLHISSDNNDENKYAAIRATKATIQFNASAQVNVSNFVIDAEDDKWTVEIQKNNNTVFKGHLVLNDCGQEFLDDELCTVTLTATDGPALLRDSPLTKPDGTYPFNSVTGNKFKIIELISWCLGKTGNNLPINVVNNLIEEWFVPTNTTLWPAYDNIFLWIKSYEDDIGTCIDCYTILEQILGEECCLCQAYGEWWIIRMDEIQYTNGILFIDQYQADGTYFNTQATPRSTHTREIGLGKSMELLAPAALISFDRKHASAKLTYDYNYPKEIIDNIDFSRGDIYIPLAQTDLIKRYHIDDWTVGRGLPNTGESPNISPYIERIFNANGYEEERYVVLNKRPVATGGINYIKANKIPLVKNDKFTFSVDAKISVSTAVTNFYRNSIAQIRLYGVSGQNYILHGPSSIDGVPAWRTSDSNFNINNDFIVIEGNVGDNKNNWHTASVTCNPLPEDGELEIILTQWGGEQDNANTYLQNLRFDYIPYLNGSYQKYNGQYNKVSQSGTLFAKVDERVYMSDSPRKLFKGAMFKKAFESLSVGDITFDPALGNDVYVHGDVTGLLSAGFRFRVNNATLNTNIFTVVSYAFSGAFTTIRVLETVQFEYVPGGIFAGPGNKFVLTGRWYDGSGGFRFAPTPEALHPLGYIQAYSVWNQYNRDMRLFDASVSSFAAPTEVPSPIYTYLLTDHSPHTYGKYFHLLHFDIDCYNAQWSGFLAEVFDENIGHKYSDPLEFKFIENR